MKAVVIFPICVHIVRVLISPMQSILREADRGKRDFADRELDVDCVVS